PILAVRRIKVGSPEGGDIHTEQLHDPLEVGQASALLAKFALGRPAAEVRAVCLLTAWPHRPSELRPALWACTEVDEAFDLFSALRASGNVRLWPRSLHGTSTRNVRVIEDDPSRRGRT